MARSSAALASRLLNREGVLPARLPAYPPARLPACPPLPSYPHARTPPTPPSTGAATPTDDFPPLNVQH